MPRTHRSRRSAAAWRAAASLVAAGAMAAPTFAFDGAAAPAATDAPAGDAGSDKADLDKAVPVLRRLSDATVAPAPKNVTPPPDWVDPFAPRATPIEPAPHPLADVLQTPEAPKPEAPKPVEAKPAETELAETKPAEPIVPPTDGALFGPLPAELQQAAAHPPLPPIDSPANPAPAADTAPAGPSVAAAPAEPGEPPSSPLDALAAVGPDGAPIAVVLFDFQEVTPEGEPIGEPAEAPPSPLFDTPEVRLAVKAWEKAKAESGSPNLAVAEQEAPAKQAASDESPAEPSAPELASTGDVETTSPVPVRSAPVSPAPATPAPLPASPAGRATLALMPAPMSSPTAPAGRAYLEFAPVRSSPNRVQYTAQHTARHAGAPTRSAEPSGPSAKPAGAAPAAPVVRVAETAEAPHVELPAAFGRFCPVAVRDDRRLAEADPRVKTEFGGKTYRFSSPVARAAFLLDPNRYLPVADGEDVVLAAAEGFAVPGRVEHAVLYGGRLFLFRNLQTRDAFAQDPGRWVDADAVVERGATPIAVVGESR
ncbi:hypothetical protein [Alienimonas chondri]|uniref:YHS domain-containing protein n=1 Tax=Alienimonas chondri TaxID=2681879 RepID=A0ABX1VFN6_9PLAN|nr:hypothetical protein [Alienimonas chondri]NNJ26643.1 hypothetical protein [Alienimonas chondri]